MNYDVFNGDADGIISLIQLRLAKPLESTLVTGVKRDINLLGKIDAKAGDSFTVLDISMEKNATALNTILANECSVFYADHHRSGDIPTSSKLDAHIDLDPNTCTALIVDALLEGQFHDWAITAAYGDNLIAKADELADKAGYDALQKAQLKELGTLVNYNGYGASEADLHIPPAELFQQLLKYRSPFEVFDDKSSPFYQLQSAYQTDIALAEAAQASYSGKSLTIITLPNEAWSKRVSGVFGNQLANQTPNKAHAVLTENLDGSFLVSLRAPLNNKQGAGDICSQFDTGGGRAAAAGINVLKQSELQRFIEVTESFYQ
ncbi:DHH family phosphoesterase [Shewanella maritima]|uniref:DHHA1 domain-containing protein n=1 Tax=Shewanella maritima TaxID=2520507 RepID=UPI00373579F3